VIARISQSSITTVLVTLALIVGLPAGDLDPPGSPEPTTPLIEPRTPIPDPTQPIAFPIVIDQPGSYCLTQNLVYNGTDNGIEITADNVTLDLNGFTLDGQGVGFAGIQVSTGSRWAVIRNGVVRGWHGGISSYTTEGVRVERVMAQDSESSGIFLGDNCEIIECQSFDNGNTGLHVAMGGMVIDSVATGNGGTGISTGRDTLVLNCVSEGNDLGFNLGTGAFIRGCVARGSNLRGIDIGNSTFVLDNNVYSNGAGASDPSTAGGIHGHNVFARIEGNRLEDNVNGIRIQSAPGNIIIRNTARDNGDDYGGILLGNDIGPTDKLPNDLDASPWANFSL
jgi:parallel beta-helix repeat protein